VHNLYSKFISNLSISQQITGKTSKKE